MTTMVVESEYRATLYWFWVRLFDSKAVSLLEDEERAFINIELLPIAIDTLGGFAQPFFS